MIDIIIFAIFIITSFNCAFLIWMYKKMEKMEKQQNTNYWCRYPDTDVQKAIIDVEFDKAIKISKFLN